MQGCPDIESVPRTSDGLMHFGNCGTSERAHAFDDCPGYYLRHPIEYGALCVSVGRNKTPLQLSAMAHWRFSCGHPLGSPEPPKLAEAVDLFERMTRMRDAFRAQARSEEAENRELARRLGAMPGQTVVSNR